MVIAALIRTTSLRPSTDDGPNLVEAYLDSLGSRAWTTPRPNALAAAHWMLHEALQDWLVRDPDEAQATARRMHLWLRKQL